MNKELKKCKKKLSKILFQANDTAAFRKTMENVRKHRDIKLLTTEKRRIIWCEKQTIIQQNSFQKPY